MVGLQDLPDEVTQVRKTFSSYSELMHAFEASHHLILDGQFAELTHEDLYESPLDSLERIYGELGLVSWEEVCHPLARRIRQAGSYRPRSVSLQEFSENVLNALLEKSRSL